MKKQFLEDFQGRTAYLYSKIGRAGSGVLWWGVSTLLHPGITKFWAPSGLVIKGSTALVTLDNPGSYGLSPIISSVIIEGIDPKFIGQALLNRDARYAEMLFGSNNIKSFYTEEYVQLELFQLPVNVDEVCCESR